MHETELSQWNFQVVMGMMDPVGLHEDNHALDHCVGLVLGRVRRIDVLLPTAPCA